jgi:hypothetical protein
MKETGYISKMFWLLMTPLLLSAAVISSGEYYINDPANGINALNAFSAGETVSIDQQIAIPADLGDGFHKIYVRLQSDEGIWGPYHSIPFLIDTSDPEEYAISGARYYFDDISNGTSDLSYSVSNGIATVNQSISTSGLSDGIHKVYVQFKDDTRGWGPAKGHMFVIGTQQEENFAISGARYYFDDISNGTSDLSYSVSNGIASVSQSISTSGLGDGIHKVYVQFKDDTRGWGPAKGHMFVIGTQQEETFAISGARYYFDDESNGTSDLSYSVSNGIATVSQSISTSGLSDGIHKVYVQFKDDTRGWGPAKGHMFVIGTQQEENFAISGARYYFDDESNGSTNLDVTVSNGIASVNQPISVEGLELGLHQVYVQFKDDTRGWGPARGHVFLVEEDNSEDFIINGARYYVDDISNGATEIDFTLENGKARVTETLELESFSAGTHTLYVQFHSESYGWGVPRGHDFTVLAEEPEARYIAAAEWFLGGGEIPAPGTATPIEAPLDGAYDEAMEEFGGTASLSGLSLGIHKIYIRTTLVSNLTLAIVV